jgi:hypothetical protein
MDTTTTMLQSRLTELEKQYTNYRIFQSADFYENISDLLGVVGYFILFLIHFLFLLTLDMGYSYLMFALSCLGFLLVFFYFYKKVEYNVTSTSYWMINSEYKKFRHLPDYVYNFRMLGHLCLAIFFFYAVFYSPETFYQMIDSILFCISHGYFSLKVLFGLYEFPGAILICTGYLLTLWTLKLSDIFYNQRILVASLLAMQYFITISLLI